MRKRHRAVLALVLAAALAPPARAELPQPACPAIGTWAQGFARGDGWSPNGLGGRDRFSALFAAPSTAALFGRPVLDWTPEEARALAPHLAACADPLRRAGQRDAASALSTLRNQAQREVPAYLTALAEARAAVPRLLEELTAPPALGLLRFHQALGGLAEAEGMTRATQAANGVPNAARASARALLAALRDLPEAELAPALAGQPARIATLREGVRDALVAEFDAVPATLPGLQTLDRRAQQALPDHAAALGPTEMARVEAALAARRAAIGVALRDEVLRQVAAVQPNLMGAQMLDRLGQQAAQTQGAAIGPEGMRAVQAAIAARRQEIGAALVTEILAGIEAMPAQISALRSLRGLETDAAPPAFLSVVGPEGIARIRQAAAARRTVLGGEVAGQIAQAITAVPPGETAFASLDQAAGGAVLDLLPPDRAEALRGAAERRRAEVAQAMLPEFRRGLAALPTTEDGLAQIDGQVLPGIAAWPASAAAEKERFAALAQERRGVILAALNRAEAGPLRGRVYEGDMVKIEFLDRTRVVLTAPAAPPVPGTYTEESDGRVTITAGQMSMVMTREGRRLMAGPVVVRRVK